MPPWPPLLLKEKLKQLLMLYGKKKLKLLLLPLMIVFKFYNNLDKEEK
jgi:hypothetical protein